MQLVEEPSQRQTPAEEVRAPFHGYDPDDIINTASVAELLGVKAGRVQQYCQDEHRAPGTGLKFQRLGKVYMFRVQDVLDFQQRRCQHNDEMERTRHPGRRYKLPVQAGQSN